MIFLQKYIILPYWANISVESFIHSAFSIDGQCDAGGIPHLQEPGHSRHEWKFYARAYHCDTIGLEEMALPCFCIKMQPSPFLFPNFCRLFVPKITCLRHMNIGTFGSRLAEFLIHSLYSADALSRQLCHIPNGIALLQKGNCFSVFFFLLFCRFGRTRFAPKFAALGDKLLTS